jgi:serine/threonine protein kinase
MIQPGTVLQNRYRVVQQVGKGGMGEVYLAMDERFQSRVAIKRTFFDDPEMSKAFRREARLLNHLRHAALPKVSDHFSEGDGQFLVMEFIEGFDFAELLTQRKVPFPLTDVLRWADELLDALDYLHTHEPPVVHRDIKPPNIKLTPRGKIVLLDFGLAKGAPAQTASGTASSVIGYSLNFAPLEQMQGSGTDPRSDLYSLAATLYSFLTGVRPSDAVTRAAAVIKEQPDPLCPAHIKQAQVPAAVSHVLQRAMSLNPAFRYSSAAEMRAALRQALSDDAPVQLNKRQMPGTANVLQQSWPSRHAYEPAESPVQLNKSVRPALQASSQAAIAAQPLRSPSTAGAEAATMVDSRRKHHFSDSDTDSTRVESPRRVTIVNKTFGLVACLLIVCTVAGAYLLTRASGSRAPAATEAQNTAPAYQQIAPAERTAPNEHIEPSDSSHAATISDTSAQSLPSRMADEKPASSTQAAPEPTGTTDASAQNAKRDGATPITTNGTTSSPVARPTLVIQNSAPAINPLDEKRRLEEFRREQPAYRPEYTNRPPPGTDYPPPPGDRRPPLPDGRRPPMPIRRPYP